MRRIVIAAAVALGTLAPTVGWSGVLVTPGGVRFELRNSAASSVAVAGSFNDWSTSQAPMVREAEGLWSAVVRLPAGTHEYKFVIDGEWLPDPDNAVTMGSFGNSVVRIGKDGQLGEVEPTSNTPYNSAIRMGGRFRSVYQSRGNPEQDDRLELRRPLFEVDLDFDTTINDVLDAHLLLKVNNEAENVDAWKTRLNFDRGHLRYDSGALRFTAWDNEGTTTFDDPLHLVGDVGIYGYDYGYFMQGIESMKPFEKWGASLQVLYADSYLDGGQSAPDPPGIVPGPRDVVMEDGIFRPSRDSIYLSRIASGDEDVAAARAKKDDLWGFDVGVSGRYDRGYNPGAFGLIDRGSIEETTLALEVETSAGLDTLDVPGVSYVVGNHDGWEEWWGFGADLRRKDVLAGANVVLEGLFGQASAIGRSGTENTVFLGTVTDVDTTFSTFVEGNDIRIVNEADRREPTSIGSTDAELAQSIRLFLGIEGLEAPAGVQVDGSLEYLLMEPTAFSTGLDATVENKAFIYRADIDWQGRTVGSWGKGPFLGFGFEAWDFEYDPQTPWDHQFWLDDRNFWLENGQDKIKAERLAFVGGDDALFYRPRAGIGLLEDQRLRLRYDGTIGTTGIIRDPKYIESLFKATYDLTHRWTLHSDVRVANYDDPILDIHDTFAAVFVEAKWRLDEDVELALSYGVDPYRFDIVRNEYGPIGREQFLFDQGANALTAREGFRSLSATLPAAERALSDERVLQVEAVVRF